MALYLIGIGLSDEKDITMKGLEAVKKCSFIFLEGYTSKLNCNISNLEKLYGKQVILADRQMVEKEAEETILKFAKAQDVAFLVIGDVLGATTHLGLLMRAKELGIKTEVIHNASILTAVGITGLSLYKFGKTTSIPFENENVETPYNVLKENGKMHTLFLLDLKPEENKFMAFGDAIKYLLKIEEKRKEKIFTKEKVCIGCAALGSKDYYTKYGKAKGLMKEKVDKFPQCLIVPGELHFMEEDFLKTFSL